VHFDIISLTSCDWTGSRWRGGQSLARSGGRCDDALRSLLDPSPEAAEHFDLVLDFSPDRQAASATDDGTEGRPGEYAGRGVRRRGATRRCWTGGRAIRKGVRRRTFDEQGGCVGQKRGQCRSARGAHSSDSSSVLPQQPPSGKSGASRKRLKFRRGTPGPRDGRRPATAALRDPCRAPGGSLASGRGTPVPGGRAVSRHSGAASQCETPPTPRGRRAAGLGPSMGAVEGVRTRGHAGTAFTARTCTPLASPLPPMGDVGGVRMRGQGGHSVLS
jgi:hypothetical protein